MKTAPAGPHHAALAHRLHEFRQRAGLTFAELAERTTALGDPALAVSAATLKRAAGCRTLPKQTTVVAYARGCGATPEEERRALRLWARARAKDRGILRQLHPPAVHNIRSRREFTAALAAVYESAGAPPLRTVQQRAGTVPQPAGVAYESEVFLLPLGTCWRIANRRIKLPAWKHCQARRPAQEPVRLRTAQRSRPRHRARRDPRVRRRLRTARADDVCLPRAVFPVPEGPRVPAQQTTRARLNRRGERNRHCPRPPQSGYGPKVLTPRRAGAWRGVDGGRYAVLQYAPMAALICLASAGLTVCALLLNRACATSSTFGDLPLRAEHWLRVLSMALSGSATRAGFTLRSAASRSVRAWPVGAAGMPATATGSDALDAVGEALDAVAEGVGVLAGLVLPSSLLPHAVSVAARARAASVVMVARFMWSPGGADSSRDATREGPKWLHGTCACRRRCASVFRQGRPSDLPTSPTGLVSCPSAPARARDPDRGFRHSTLRRTFRVPIASRRRALAWHGRARTRGAPNGNMPPAQILYPR
ncbi:helix-turn-helix domain-containing protein [Streptomyces actinomycinicus]|uniref:Helix-turn-helix domain-containing protein n=1 Tax=Streptomyces actinomycinicus TaxID=1695166 RepID=A0A937ESX4_9ACTN|nr:helix-turn-helix domain-containing protein [Streptomyces actinomycinicus]